MVTPFLVTASRNSTLTSGNVAFRCEQIPLSGFLIHAKDTDILYLSATVQLAFSKF